MICLPAKKTTEETPEVQVENTRFYSQFMTTPDSARKEIGAGRLKGYTDINPMWRIRKLTEVFGPCGFGWWTQNEKYSFEPCSTGEIAIFCTLELVVVDPVSKEQSHPISGVGGNKFVTNERNGAYCNDEAMKMAYTDALSIACKSLGFSHDIYYSKDRTKYSIPEETAFAPTPEDYQAITKRIQNGISLVTKEYTKEQKEEFTQNVVVKHIGGANYMTCKDMNKLNALLEELLSLAKKAA